MKTIPIFLSLVILFILFGFFMQKENVFSPIFSPETSASSTQASTSTMTPVVSSTRRIELGVWMWESPTEFTEQTLRDSFAYARGHGVTSIYLSIDGYVDVFDLADETKRRDRVKSFKQALQRFVSLSSQYGIEVQALAGNEQWTDLSYRYIPLTLLDFVVEYNSGVKVSERLAGFQFDIEFYSQEKFKKKKESEKREVYGEYLSLASELVAKVQNQPGFKLGFAIPYWFDNENGRVLPFTWKGEKKPIGFHLMDILSRLTRGYVVLMDYRNFVAGKDGSIVHAEDEFAYARTMSRAPAILIGQLVSASTEGDETATFYKKDKQALALALKLLLAAFQDEPAFAGFAIHHFKAYRSLLES